jgi:hypothetical protein
LDETITPPTPVTPVDVASTNEVQF